MFPPQTFTTYTTTYDTTKSDGAKTSESAVVIIGTKSDGTPYNNTSIFFPKSQELKSSFTRFSNSTICVASTCISGKQASSITYTSVITTNS